MYIFHFQIAINFYQFVYCNFKHKFLMNKPITFVIIIFNIYPTFTFYNVYYSNFQ